MNPEGVVQRAPPPAAVAAAADSVRARPNRIRRILQHFVARARRSDDLSGSHIPGIDEFTPRKGHRYMAGFSEIEAAQVVFLAESRREEVIGEFAGDTASRGRDRSGIDLIRCDMWNPYLTWIRTHLPHAGVIFDRSHNPFSCTGCWALRPYSRHPGRLLRMMALPDRPVRTSRALSPLQEQPATG